ncbi:MAG: VIT1/CCC1 transporter family protein [SAR202 cluster bacterium]|nr:VIT1/CCC1 transporter family protein [SAR202 cluster bacterium]
MSEGVSDERYRKYLDSELEAVALYTALADVEEDPARAEIFLKLVDAELKHAGRWAEKLGMDPALISSSNLGVKGLLLKWGARIFGTRRVLPVLLRLEAKETAIYSADPEAVDLVLEERRHSRTLRDMSRPGSQTDPQSPSTSIGGSGSLRAAILGVNDGLVSNFSLVMGVAGGTGNADFVLLAGLAGLFAGAFSMAVGEYVSMRSQRDIYEFELAKERIELIEWPEEELEELELIYQAKGLSAEEASTVAQRVMADPEVALDTMAREELGLDPSELGSPRGAAFASFLAFVGGALVPIAPHVLQAGDLAFLLSAGLSAAALLIVGSTLASMSGRTVWWGGLRMLLAGGAAATVTYGIGSLVGIPLG